MKAGLRYFARKANNSNVDRRLTGGINKAHDSDGLVEGLFKDREKAESLDHFQDLEESQHDQKVTSNDKQTTSVNLTPTKTWMASRNVVINSLPKNLLLSAKSLFSSFPSEKIRNWGYQTVQSYVQLAGVEKPMDIRKIQPFATSLRMIDEEVKTPQNRGFYKLPDEKLSESYPELLKQKGLNEGEKHMPYQKEHAVGYAYKKMPNTYSSIFRILHEVKHRMTDFQPVNCLDYGAGTGAGLWAANELWPDIQITAVEPSKEMRTVGKKLSAKLPNAKWAESLANLPSIANKEGLFDVVICGYVLSEIENPVTRNLILDALWHRTGKVMVFVEPGTPKGSRLIYNIRQWTLNTMTRDQANIVAPCPHDGQCPLAAHPKSWCHFSQFTAKYTKDVISRVKGESNFENEKFSYIVVCRGPSPRHLDANLQLDLAQQSFLWSRFVRPAIRRKRHIIFDVCRLDKLERIVLSKGKTNKEVYKFLRNVRWGDLWPFDEKEYFDVQKREEKFKKYRIRRKIKKRERKLAEKGQSEGTDLEEEKKKIVERMENFDDEAGKTRNNQKVVKKIRDLTKDGPGVQPSRKTNDSQKFNVRDDFTSLNHQSFNTEKVEVKENRSTSSLKTRKRTDSKETSKNSETTENSESFKQDTQKLDGGRRSNRKNPKAK